MALGEEGGIPKPRAGLLRGGSHHVVESARSRRPEHARVERLPVRRDLLAGSG